MTTISSTRAPTSCCLGRLPTTSASQIIPRLSSLRAYQPKETVQIARLRQEAIDYLKALPEKAGDGNYKLTTELTLDVPRSGYYTVVSCFVDKLKENATADDIIYSVAQEERFYFDLETGIVSVSREDDDNGPYVGLNGVVTNSRPQRKGIYIHKGRKVIR